MFNRLFEVTRKTKLNETLSLLPSVGRCTFFYDLTVNALTFRLLTVCRVTKTRGEREIIKKKKNR